MKVWGSKVLPKCELLCITNPSIFSYYMNGEKVRSVSNAKYLEVTLDKHLTFNDHIKKIVNKANQVKGFFTKKHWFLPS